MKQKLKNFFKKNSILDKIYNRLFRLKLLKRRIAAKTIRVSQMKSSLIDISSAPQKPKIYFCGVPTHNNMGDQAQRYCIRKWCTENYPEYYLIEIPSWALYERKLRQSIKAGITSRDIFIIQSGYTTTDRHFDHEMHRFVVKEFTESRILIMPQTVNFFENSQAELTGKIFDKHKRLLFLARDKISFEKARRIFRTTKVLCYPDIVTTLIGTMNTFHGVRKGVLLCMRNDTEKKYSDTEINNLRAKFLGDGISCEITDTNSNLPADKLINQFEEELCRIIRYYSQHQVIITDRYHGTIFSLISNTPVIVLATNDHKVKTGTQWFEGVYENAYYNANSIDEAYQLAASVLAGNLEINNEPYFKLEYYDKLKKLFDRETSQGSEETNDKQD